MKNIKLLVLTILTALSTSVWAANQAEVMYVVSGKCNVPLTKGMSNSTYQLFTWDGTTATKTEDITCKIDGDNPGTGGNYYNSTSLSWSDLKTTTNYSTGSSSNRTMQAIKLSGDQKLTISLGSKTMSKVLVVGYVNSKDALTLDVLGESISTNAKGYFVVEKEQSFQGSIEINNTTGKEYHFFFYMIEGEGGGSTTVPVTGVTLNKTELTLEAGQSETLTATVAPSNATNKAVTWTSSKEEVATVSADGVVSAVAEGEATITVATVDGDKTATCAVTVSAPANPIPVTAIALNKTSTTIYKGATETLTVSYTPENANTGKAVVWSSDKESVATVTNGVVKGISEGTANITVKTTDDKFSATCAVTVEKAALPQTNLSIHVPDVYQEKYRTNLVEKDGRYFEVYYAGRYDNGGTKLTIHTKPIDKSHGITKNETGTAYEATDDWFKGSGTDKGTGFAVKDEFTTATTRCHTMGSSNSVELHIKGFDQFSLYAMDKKWTPAKPNDCKYFKVLIDGQLATMEQSTDATIRRFDISEDEHVIKIEVIGDGNLFGAFSLREAQTPRVRYVEGNDTTQNVLVTQNLKNVTYYVKNGKVSGAKTELKWDGETATGISLDFNAAGDTALLKGTVMCDPGLYKYAIVTTLNGIETSTVNGKFNVSTDIKTERDTIIDAYIGEEMDPLEFRYFAKDASAITITWKDRQGNDCNPPAGLEFTDNTSTHKYRGSGLITADEGTYRFTITIAGNTETVITGEIIVLSQDLGTDPILYLYRDRGLRKSGSDEITESVFALLKDKNLNVKARRTLEGTRQPDFYKQFKAIIISEDVSADCPEVLDILSGNATSRPILNMKGFTYAQETLNWGKPDNGTVDTVSHNSGSIFIQRGEHPIFSKFTTKDTETEIKILNYKDLEHDQVNGVMPIQINSDLGSTYCLATAYTRSMKEDDPTEAYYKDGVRQTVIHEIPSTGTGRGKYICLPLALRSLRYLTDDGKKLIEGIMDYLLGNEQFKIEQAVDLGITEFSIDGEKADINQGKNTISLTMDRARYEELDNFRKIKPVIKLSDPEYTFVSPASREEITLEYSMYLPYKFVVSDYIRIREYEFSLTLTESQGIDEIYAVGDWVNIYDIYGRKVATTNENIFMVELPHGVYIAVTAAGKTIKILR